jgi:hypothetical protein
MTFTKSLVKGVASNINYFCQRSELQRFLNSFSSIASKLIEYSLYSDKKLQYFGTKQFIILDLS